MEARKKIESVYLKGWDQKSLDQITAAVDTLQSIKDKYHFHRHATETEQNAKDILSQGIKTRMKTLADFSHDISEHRDLMAQHLFHNTHEARPYAVVIAIPKHPDYYNTVVASDGRNAWDNEKISAEFAKKCIFEIEDTPSGKINVVPPKFIVGYWDDMKREWHPNALFESATKEP